MIVANILAQVISTPGLEVNVMGASATAQIPPAQHVVIDEIIICNRGGATTVRVSISLGGAATALTDYLYYDTPIAANDTLSCEIGVTLAGNDTLRGESPGNVTFTVVGQRT